MHSRHAGHAVGGYEVDNCFPSLSTDGAATDTGGRLCPLLPTLLPLYDSYTTSDKLNSNKMTPKTKNERNYIFNMRRNRRLLQKQLALLLGLRHTFMISKYEH